MMMGKTYLTGIQATGMPHIGNLAGAILPAIKFSQEAGPNDQCLYFIADYHALNKYPKADELKQNIYEVAATWLAFGLDPEKVLFYRQSDIPEILELNWILACYSPKGDMNRAHSYKDMVQKNTEVNKDPDQGINMGLYTYPILMAADILMFNTDIVPVGKDQRQHVEMARSIAQRINALNKKELLIEPQESINDEVALIQGLDGRKMSKSYNNTIPVFVTEKKLRKLVNKITTDSTPPGEPKDPNNSLVFDIYKSFATKAQQEELAKKYAEGISWGEAKAELFEVLNSIIAGPRKCYEELMENKEEIDALLEKGAIKARKIAQRNLKEIKKHLLG